MRVVVGEGKAIGRELSSYGYVPFLKPDVGEMGIYFFILTVHRDIIYFLYA